MAYSKTSTGVGVGSAGVEGASVGGVGGIGVGVGGGVGGGVGDTYGTPQELPYVFFSIIIPQIRS